MTVAQHHNEMAEETRRKLEALKARIAARAIPLATLEELAELATLEYQIAKHEEEAHHG